MTTIDLDAPERALAFGAHPDDIEFGAAATLHRWASAGTDVRLVVLTDGSKGTWDPTHDPATLIATRESEQHRAAETIGAAGVDFARFVDGALSVGDDAVEVVCAALRSHRPDIVFAHDPWRRHRVHPDHQAAGAIVVQGLVAARDPHFYPEIGPGPHRPRHVLFYESDAVNHVERLEANDVERKVAALLSHESQWESTMAIAADHELDVARFAHRIRLRARAAGARVGSGWGEPFLRHDGF